MWARWAFWLKVSQLLIIRTGRATIDKTLKIKHRNGINKYKTYFQAARIINSLIFPCQQDYEFNQQLL